MHSDTTTKWLLLAAMLALCLTMVAGCDRSSQESALVSTFNIELYPKHDERAAALFPEVAALGSPVVAIQEVREAEVFRRDAREHLGPNWEYVEAEHCGWICLGVLFDTTRVKLVRTQTHRETQLHPDARPVFEAVLEIGDTPVTVFVVHFKAKPDGIGIRERQFEALTEIINNSRPRRTEITVVGDFNSVTERDERLLKRFASSTGLAWNSSQVPCSHYWEPERTCITTTLDHVFSTMPDAQADAEGACGSVGCRIDGACPVYRERVSDHCPVTLSRD